MTKVVNIYVVFDLDTWSKNSSKNSKFKNWQNGATNTVNNNEKDKCVCSAYGIAFDSSSS